MFQDRDGGPVCQEVGLRQIAEQSNESSAWKTGLEGDYSIPGRQGVGCVVCVWVCVCVCVCVVCGLRRYVGVCVYVMCVRVYVW